MAYIRNISGAIIGIVLLAAPFTAAHAQTFRSWNTANWNTANRPRPPQHGYVHAPQYTYVYPSPTCTISITTQNNSGGYATSGTLSWNSNYASSANLAGLGSVTTTGTAIVPYVYPYETFTLTVSNPEGSNTCQVEYNPYQYPGSSYWTGYPS